MNAVEESKIKSENTLNKIVLNFITRKSYLSLLPTF